MRLAAAAAGTTDGFGRPSRNRANACLVSGRGRGSQTESLAIIGRALALCGALGLGLGTFLAKGISIDGLTSPAVAAPVFAVPPLKPQLKLASVSSESSDLVIGAVKDSRVDRVPYELMLPQGYGDPDELLEFGPRKIRRHLVETIIKAAKATDSDPVLLMAIADKESSFSTTVRARTSSATGLFQFIDATWLRTMKNFGARHGLEKEAAAINWVDDELTVSDPTEKARILELRRDPYISALLAAEMLKRDRSRIAGRIGRDLTDGETYLAHFLGPDDAERFMEKVVEAPKAAAAKLLPKPARANRPIFFARGGRKAKSLSVAEVHERFQAMMGSRLDRYRKVHQVAGTVALAEATAP
jgi:hypothetical protein